MKKNQVEFTKYISFSNKNWKTIISLKQAERNFFLLFHHHFLEKLSSISFADAKWVDIGYVIVETPEYEIYLEENQFGYQKIIGFWGYDACIISTENKVISLCQEEKEILVELLVLFRVNGFIDQLEEYRK